MTSAERMWAWRKANPERTRAISDRQQARIRADVELLEARRENSRRYYSNNQKSCLLAHKTWRELNQWAVISDRCRTLIRSTVQGSLDGGKRFQSLAGCTGRQLRKHLESLWLPGMNWFNLGRGGWTIGHIKAVAHFKDSLDTEQGRQACFHFSNLQPEWERSNIAKHISDSLTPTQLILDKWHLQQNPPVIRLPIIAREPAIPMIVKPPKRKATSLSTSKYYRHAVT